jgi:Protein of unknown function (DUF2808)
MVRRRCIPVALGLTTALVVSALSSGAAHAQPEAELLNAATEQLLSSRRDAYEFTVAVPPDAEAAVAAVIVEQLNPNRLLEFNLAEIAAFQGPSGSGAPLAIETDDQSAPDRLQIDFVTPVAPGESVTIQLPLQRLPQRDQRSEIGISVLPAVANPAPTLLGYQRVTVARCPREAPFSFHSQSDHRVLFWELPPEFDPRRRCR